MSRGAVIKKYMGWLVVSSFVYLQFLIQTSSSLMQNAWADFFHLSPLDVSFLSAAFFYTYLFFQIPIGIIYDRYSAKKVLALATLGLSISSVMFAFSTHYYFAVFTRLIMGACAAFGFLGMLKVTAHHFPGKQFAMMMGISESIAAIVTTVGVIILSWGLTHTNWQHLMLYLAASIFIIMLAVIGFVDATPEHSETKFNFMDLIKNIYAATTNVTVLITGMYGFFMFAVINSFTSLWGVAFLTNVYSMNAQLAAKLISTIFIGLAVGCPINGYISKKFGHEREAMQICALLSFICMGMIIVFKVPLLLLYILFFIVGMTCSIYVQSFAIIGQIVPSNIQATSMAVANLLIMASAPVLQILIGALLNNHSFGLAQTYQQNYQMALSVLPIGMLLAFILCFFIQYHAEPVN